MSTLFTIGHSNHSLDRFLELLQQHQITAIGDVRSTPYSRYCPQFNPPALKPALAAAGIAYVFLGRELGARPDDPQCYVDGSVSYERLAMRREFGHGLERVSQGVVKYRLALMCTEKDPIDCHRMILICHRLRSKGLAIHHVLADSSIETNEAAERRLCEKLDLRPTLFETQEQIVEQAYGRQAKRISYKQEDDLVSSPDLREEIPR
jgi:uncharacterized protein (DUF488 family)